MLSMHDLRTEIHWLIPIQVKAKAIFERDLAALRARRAERERAAGADRLRAAGLERSASQAAALPAATTEVDASALNDYPIATIEGSMEGLEGISVNLDSSMENATFAPGTITEAADGTNLEDAAADGTPSDTIRIDTSLQTNERGDVDFESMFNSAGAEGHNIDFDLDFSTADLSNSTNLQDDPFADLGTRMEFTKSGGIDFSKGADGDVGDTIEVLMPGLENFVTAASSTSANGASVPVAQTTGAESTEASKIDKSMEIDFSNLEDGGGDTSMDVGGESSFDQMFFDGSGEMGMDGDMDGEIEDWFKNM